MTITLTCLALCIQSQDIPGRSAFSAEIFGVSQLFSANYERILAQQSSYFVSGRVGIGVGGFGWPGIPHGVTFNFGKTRNYFETGLLASLGPTSFGFADAGATFYYFAPMVGYRSHPARGFLFKIYLSPFIPVSRDFDVILRGGISFGYAFTRKEKLK